MNQATGTVLASSLTAEQQRNVLTPDQGGAGGDAAQPQMVAGGGKLRGVFDQGAKRQLQNRARNRAAFAITELNGGNTQAAISALKEAIAECERIDKIENPPVQ